MRCVMNSRARTGSFPAKSYARRDVLVPGDRQGDPLVQVTEGGREAPRSQASNTRNECVVERGEDAARRDSLVFNSAYLLILLVDPCIHELAEEGPDVLLRGLRDHLAGYFSGSDRRAHPRRT